MRQLFIVDTVLFCITLLSSSLFGQKTSNSCMSSELFCDSISYPLGVNSGSGEPGFNYSCLATTPNPAWFLLVINEPGDIEIELYSNPARDIDYVCWGPFYSYAKACDTLLYDTVGTDAESHSVSGPGGGYPIGNIIDCSYNSSYQEWLYIPNAEFHTHYLLMITNYSNQPANLYLLQANQGQSGAGSLSCSNGNIYLSNTFHASPCNNLNSTFSISGTINMINYPAGGHLELVDDISQKTSVYYPPFSNTTVFTIDSIPADGLTHNISIRFSACACDTNIQVQSPIPCVCSADAGFDTTFCSLIGHLHANLVFGETNGHWNAFPGITFSNLNYPLAGVLAQTNGLYPLVWTSTSPGGTTCNDTVLVRFARPPEITIETTNPPCVENDIEIFNTATSSLHYTWTVTGPESFSGSDIMPLQISADSVGEFMVKLETWDVPQCKSVDSTQFSTQVCDFICIVSVDSSTGKNKIVLNHSNPDIDYYKIFKETATNVYTQIGSISPDTAVYYIDYTSNPMVHSDKYKVSSVDNSGVETSPGYYHQTMNLSLANYGNVTGLLWNPYVDESGIFIPGKYYIFRSPPQSPTQLFDSLSASFTTYNDLTSGQIFDYKISTRREVGCSGSKNTSPESFSNTRCNSTVSPILEADAVEIQIFPNPASDQITIVSDIEIVCIKITDVAGRNIHEAFDQIPNPYTISTIGYQSGCYFIEVKSFAGNTRSVLIIE